jgi:hypothetical protein
MNNNINDKKDQLLQVCAGELTLEDNLSISNENSKGIVSWNNKVNEKKEKNSNNQKHQVQSSKELLDSLHKKNAIGNFQG